MFLDALSFLDEEREAWRPFEALGALPDESLQHPLETAHGWSGRDLMGHLTACQDFALQAARELAVSETSAVIARIDADWEARGGDVVNEELRAAWAALPLDEVRRRFRTVPGEMRGYLTVVPETRWVKHPRNMSWLVGETLDHYAEHEADLRAILDAAR